MEDRSGSQPVVWGAGLLTLRYGIGYDGLVDGGTAIYGKPHETLPMHYLSVDDATRQPRGSIRAGIDHRNYLNVAPARNTQIQGK